MEKSIIEYQKCFNNIIDRLKNNELVIAVLVFGSMVNGDLWDGSDIDFLIVVDDKNLRIENVYTDENDVPVHIKIIGKTQIINMYKDELLRRKLNVIFASSKLVFCRDRDVTTLYDNRTHCNDTDREKLNLVYLGELLKYINICKKYIANDKIYRAYTLSLKLVELFAKLYVNFSGYIVSKESMIIAMNLNEDFKYHIDDLFFCKTDKLEAVENSIKYFDDNVDKNIVEYTKFLVEYIKSKDKFLSVEDIKKDKVFSNFNIYMADILLRLYEKNIIKRKKRNYEIGNKSALFEEWVYFL